MLSYTIIWLKDGILYYTVTFSSLVTAETLDEGKTFLYDFNLTDIDARLMLSQLVSSVSITNAAMVLEDATVVQLTLEGLALSIERFQNVLH